MKTALAAATVLVLCALTPAAASAEVVLVEAESFQDRGGWVLDQQFILQMGSPYLLAHGLGRPVKDAATTVALPKAGTWRVFVRTQDWVAKFGAAPPAGTFQVLVEGKPLAATFGAKGAEWQWQDGGEVEIAGKQVKLALRDLTGFEGRCDAIVLTDQSGLAPPNQPAALAAFRRKMLNLPDRPRDAGEFDLVVIGGGIAGTCAAVSAARSGCTVALIQDRPVLGGSNSSEVRVWLGGQTNLGPYPRIGDIVRELDPNKHVSCPAPADHYDDDKKLKVVRAEKNISLHLNHFAHKVETEAARITAVTARNVVTGQEVRFRGRYFADCTGDGTIGHLAGAEFDMTRKGHMGRTNLWYLEDTKKPSPFPRCPWAIDLSERPFPTQLNRLGKWFWESGFHRDPIAESELIRDTNFRAMYGAWDALKNVKKLYPNHRLAWAAYIAGKRESRRLLGDVLLTKEDVVSSKRYPDGFVPCTWSIDLHLPDKRYDKGFEGGAEFLSKAHYTSFRKPYLLPYRCLYSRNVENLFMAGRDISVTHEALGTVRVMRTCGMGGEVVGKAAAVAKKHDATPRQVYQKHLEELKAALGGPVGPRPKEAEAFLKRVGKNLAPAAKLSASGHHESNRPLSLVADGKDETADNHSRWLSHAEVPNWVQFTWAAPQTIRAARVVSGYRTARGVTAPIEDFSLQYEADGEWRDVPGASVKGNAHVDWFAEFKPLRAAKIRLLVTSVQIDVSRIWEIALHAPPAETPQ